MAPYDLKPAHNGGFSHLAMSKRQFFEVPDIESAVSERIVIIPAELISGPFELLNGDDVFPAFPATRHAG